MQAQPRCNAILLLPRNLPEWEVAEAYSLLSTAGYNVVSVIRYRRQSRTRLLSDTKLKEVEAESAKIKRLYEPRIVVYDDIRPVDYFRLYKATGLEIVDRTMLILEIFELHAGSREAKLQIELARLRHRLPIIREFIRRAKLRELPGFLGPGEYAIDAYYKFTMSRIAKIRRELEKLRERRARERSKRRSRGLPHVSIVGYASAGKTTLFNALTGLSKPTGPEYFTTLAPKVYGSSLTNGFKVAFIDTVGFISRIPPEIIEAFHATLEEITYSDLIIFVLDVSEPEHVTYRKLKEGLNILSRIGVVDKPLIIACNKVDLLDEGEVRRRMSVIESIAPALYFGFRGVVPVSALKGYGVDELRCRLVSLLKDMVRCTS